MREKRKLKILAYTLGVLSLLLLTYLITLYIQVSRDASDRIKRGVIDSITFSESPVYFDDGETPIGVFFDRIHSRHLPFEETPKMFIKAIIATEDKRFFDHPGFDIRAIVRALITRYGGGSTITQQTAKNIFKRRKESIITIKLKELIQAVLLERKYSKEEILEMYINQSISIRGFGRGLSIAARYFFDKTPQDLDLVENAFMAGYANSLRFDPFLKKKEADREETKRLANMRKNYVLKAMRRNNFITEEEYLHAKETEIPFNEGKITYNLSVALDYVREQLESDYFRAILQEQGIENISTSGIKIYTSVNKEIQEGALRILRQHLPQLDVKLTGYGSLPAQEKSKGSQPNASVPFFCRITDINKDPQNPSVVVAWDTGGGIIDYEGIRPIGDAWLKWKRGSWSLFDKRYIQEFLETLKVGEEVEVQVMAEAKENGQTRYMLSKKPELNGGIIVLHKGMIKAMVGGFEDRFFNRAVDAKRQLGSIFKPLVYTAALGLKWNSLEELTNMRDLFQYQNTFYKPKDHEPGPDQVSMLWAGAASENIATVWLLYHLTDKLNMSEFREVVELLGLARKAPESYQAYEKRIRDKHGVVVNREARSEAAFNDAKREIETDLIFMGYEEALRNVRRLHYRVKTSELNLKEPDETLIHRLTFQKLSMLNIDMKADVKKVRDILDSYTKNRSSTLTGDLSEALRRFYFTLTPKGDIRLVYTDSRSSSNDIGLHSITPQWVLDREGVLPIEEIWIDEVLPSQVVDLLHKRLKDNYDRLKEHRPYDLEVLSKVRDFKVLVNLYYVKRASEIMGISSRLDPVLSFPFGVNSISIIEAALVYHTIMTGDIYPLSDHITPGMVPLIMRIVGREGETIWEYHSQRRNILHNKVSSMVSEILRMVIQEGTGRMARDAIQLSVRIGGDDVHIPIPAFGKTGTADSNINSSFVGFFPGLKRDPSRLNNQEGYVIAGYVGYDDNRPMEGEHISIYGSSGALPIWIETANVIVNSPMFKQDLQFADLIFSMPSFSVMNEEKPTSVEVSTTTGLPLGDDDEKGVGNVTQTWAYTKNGEGTMELNRIFSPIIGAGYEEGLEN
ncbi:MAG: transglycosylase domain-containing protein [Deltaproteobacteria bacterium]|nr:transglycosylase domain-containing protein [Deltaproteobacteria bacterium]